MPNTVKAVESAPMIKYFTPASSEVTTPRWKLVST